MKKIALILNLSLFLLFFITVKTCYAKDKQGRYVFAYLENGEYTDLTRHKNLIFAQLDKIGLKDKYVMPKELIMSPGWTVAKSVLEDAAEKIMTNPNVDLIFSMGTAATKALLAKNNGQTPIVGIDISDAYRSGIITSPTDTGTDNLTLLYIQNGWLNVFNTIYQISSGFKKLGIIYEDSVNGRTFANLEDSIEAGRTLGFEIIPYPHYDHKKPFTSCINGIAYFIEQGVDALYLSDLECYDKKLADAQEIIDFATDNNIATFSNLGDTHLSSGALISVSNFSGLSIGVFYADKIKKILEDKALPRSLPINAEFTPEIMINLKTGEKLGIDFSMPILLSADKIYDKKEGQDE